MALLHFLKDSLLGSVPVSPNDPLPVTPGVSGAAGSATASFGSADVTLTRTANTTAYTANDVIGIDNAGSAGAAALTFANMGRAGGGNIMITSVMLEVDDTGVISGETSYDLHLYSVTPPSALLDNAAFDLPSGDRASYLGKVSLGTPVDIGSTLYVETHGVNKQVALASSSLFGYLVTVGAYTPTSGRVYRVKLRSIVL